ncbi:DUF3352 domain-containing protein [Sesbania bispinosa]|nr:DUF3352 domain-containing protein [Sesbania bispinosa]
MLLSGEIFNVSCALCYCRGILILSAFDYFLVFFRNFATSANQKKNKIIAQNIFSALQATPSSPLQESQLHSPLDSPPTPLEKKTESKKLSKLFLMHDSGKNSTARLEWNSSPEPFNFGSFEPSSPAPSTLQHLKEIADFFEIVDVLEERPHSHHFSAKKECVLLNVIQFNL